MVEFKAESISKGIHQIQKPENLEKLMKFR